MALFQDFDLTLDEDTIETQVYDYLIAHFPDWSPREGHLEVIWTEAIAVVVSMLLDMVADVPPAVFRWFGKNLIRLEPLDAVQATVQATVFSSTEAAQTLFAGTSFLFEDTEGNTIAFQVVEDVPLPLSSVADVPAQTAPGAVTLLAEEFGEIGNGLSGTPRLFDTNDWFSEITLVGATAGGRDAEDDLSYQNRLADRLQILKDGPVLAKDTEPYLRTLIPGIARVCAVDNAQPSGGGSSLTLDLEKAIAWSAVTEAGEPISTEDRATATAALQESRELNFLFGYTPPTYSVVAVTVNAKIWPTSDLTVASDRIRAALDGMFSPAFWGETPLGEVREWLMTKNVTADMIHYAVLSVDDVMELNAPVTFSVASGANNGSAKVLPGAFPLSRSGSHTITVAY